MCHVLSRTESPVYVGMFFILLLLAYAYAWEYVRYKTKVRQTRPLKKVIFGWLGLIGLYVGVACPPLALVAWLIAGLGYAWDSYIVDRLP